MQDRDSQVDDELIDSLRKVNQWNKEEQKTHAMR